MNACHALIYEETRKYGEWDYFFMKNAELVSDRATCRRRKVGAVAVKNKHIIATGYNGAPSKFKHCTDRVCIREELLVESGTRHELCRAVHAEQNLIVQAAMHGTSLKGADVYCTHMPCSICFKLLVNCGVKHVYFLHGYPDELTIELLWEYWNIHNSRFFTQIKLEDGESLGKA